MLRELARDALARAAYAAGELLIGAAVRLQSSQAGLRSDAPPDGEADTDPPPAGDEPSSLGDYEIVGADKERTVLPPADDPPLRGSKAAQLRDASRRMR